MRGIALEQAELVSWDPQLLLPTLKAPVQGTLSRSHVGEQPDAETPCLMPRLGERLIAATMWSLFRVILLNLTATRSHGRLCAVILALPPCLMSGLGQINLLHSGQYIVATSILQRFRVH